MREHKRTIKNDSDCGDFFKYSNIWTLFVKPFLHYGHYICHAWIHIINVYPSNVKIDY